MRKKIVFLIALLLILQVYSIASAAERVVRLDVAGCRE